MVEIDKIRAEFAKRLHKACDLAGVRERGRAVDIQKALKALTVHASTTAIGKWLNGDSLPEPDKLLPLADWLKVRPEWLEYGRGQRAVQPSSEVMETGGTYRLPKEMIPLPMEYPMDLPAASKVGARAIAEVWTESRKDSAHLERLTNDIPLTLRIRQAKEALSSPEWKDSDDVWSSVVGISRCPREALELLDSILEALASGAIDLEEIQAITTLVKKRRNEKANQAKPGKKAPNRAGL